VKFGLARRGVVRAGEESPAPRPAGGPVGGGDVPLDESTEHFVPGSARLEPHGPVWKIVDAVVLVGVGGMVLTVALQVISRSLGVSVSWTEELTRFLFIYTAFLGMAAGFRHAEHARIAFLIAKLPRVGQQFAVHLYAVAGIAFFVVVGVTGWELVMQQFESGEISPVLGVGMYLSTLPVVISAGLAILGHLQSVYRSPRLRQSIERGEMTAA
jgi:TRAP-type C4-dicarboxylate transport system permease small subunit